MCVWRTSGDERGDVWRYIDQVDDWGLSKEVQVF